MALSNFQKFLEDKKAAGSNGGDPTPKVKMSVVPDYTGKKSDAPVGGRPYQAGKSVGPEHSEAPKGENNGESLAEKGDKTLVYTPADAYTKTVNLKTVSGDKKLKSETFIDRTKGMNPTQFAEFMSKKNVNLGEVQDTVGRFSSLVKNNPSGVSALVGEARRNGYFRALMSEMLQYPESMAIVAKLLGDETEGMAAARRLAKAMNEMVGPPMHKTLGAGAPPKKGLPAPGMGGPDDGTAPPDDGSGMGDPNDPNAPDDDDDLGDDDDDAGLDDGSDPDDDGTDPDDDGSDPDDDGTDPDDGSDPNAPDDGSGGPPDDGSGDPNGGMMGGPPPGKKPPFSMKLPRPSMMNRMMRPESNSPAVQNFMKALQG